METSHFTFTPSARKVMLTMFWDSQGVLLAHFQKCGENVKYALYYEALLKLQDAIHRKRPDQLAKVVQLPYDNARPHTTQATQERIQELQWELLEHLPYSPNLAPSDFHPFYLPKKTTLVADVSLMKRLKQQSKYFYAVGFNALVK
jgi:hypothetical protein